LDKETTAAAEAGLIRLEGVAWEGESVPDLEARLAGGRDWVASLMDLGALESVKHPALPPLERETTRSILSDLKGYDRPAGPKPARPEPERLPAELGDPGAILYLAAQLERDWAESQAGLAGARAREKDMLRAALGEVESSVTDRTDGTEWFTPTEDMAVVWLAAWQTLWDRTGDWQSPLVTDVPGLVQLMADRTIEAVFTSPTEVVMPPGLGPRPRLWFSLELPDAAVLGPADGRRLIDGVASARETLIQSLEDFCNVAREATWSVQFETEAPAKVKQAGAALDQACQSQWPPDTALARMFLDAFAFPGLTPEEVLRIAAGSPPSRQFDAGDVGPKGVGMLFSIRRPA
jgi:hypothetical protein